MKERRGFVSNSSSSSFVVIPENYQPKVNENYGKLAMAFAFSVCDDWNGIFIDGEHAFDWQVKQYHDFESKWNWLVLQAFYGGQKYMEIINNFLSSITSNRVKVNWNGVEDADNNCYAYIDHQSVDPKCTFDEVARIGIGNFLLDSNCYIQNGNDNE